MSALSTRPTLGLKTIDKFKFGLLFGVGFVVALAWYAAMTWATYRLCRLIMAAYHHL